MNYSDLHKILSDNEEDEHFELKEAQSSFSVLGDGRERRSVYGYTVALANEGGGKLILGVSDDKKIIGSKALQNIQEVKSQIFQHAKIRISIDEIMAPGGERVLLIDIPPHPVGQVLKFYGVALMRVGEELREMDDLTQRNILNEIKADFSAQVCSGLSFSDLDSQALEKLTIFYSKKNDNVTIPVHQLLSDLRLAEGEKLNYAGLILLGKEDAIQKHLDNAEIIFQYRNNKNITEYQDRVDYKKAFLLLEGELWNKINSRNQISQMAEGFLTREISSFNEEVIKEAVLNAVAHRNYTDPGSIIIKQSPEEIFIQSPGGFVTGVNPQNILTQTKPRNRRIAEVLQHLGFVQRAGQGADLIFRKTIEEGKGLPDYSGSDEHQVSLILPAMVQDKSFIKYLEKVANEKQISFSVDELIALQHIKNSSRKFTQQEIKRFLDLGIVEQIGRTRGAKYDLAHSYYVFEKRTGVATRNRGLKREVKKQMIIDHLKRNKDGGTLHDFFQAFPEMKRQDISNLLQELKRAKAIMKASGSTRGVIWKLNNN